MTAVKGAGYNANKSSAASSAFDPLGLSSAPAAPLAPRSITSPELQCKELEKAIHGLLEESAAFLHGGAAGSGAKALEKAKDAVKRERHLSRQREKYGLLDSVNHDLTYAVLFNLANTYARCQLHGEALNTYGILIKNKQYPQAQRLRVNIGALHFAAGDYQAAVKAFRMGIDHLSAIGMRELRARVMGNIAVCFLKLGQYQDAIHTLEAIMDAAVIDKTGKDAPGKPAGAAGAGGRTGSAGAGSGLSVGGGDVQTGFNLLVCYFALGDKEKMKKGFSGLLALEDVRGLREDDDEEDEAEDDDLLKTAAERKDEAETAADRQLLSHHDELTVQRRDRQRSIQRYLILAARLIAPCIEQTVEAGFDWVIEELRKPKLSAAAAGGSGGAAEYGGFASHHLSELDASRPGYPVSAMHLLLAKGISFLHANNLQAAIEVFRSFHHAHQSTAAAAGGGSGGSPSSSLIDHAATNLSFLYFLETDLKMAAQYADLALQRDRYNAKALVNKANTLFAAADFGAAKELYLEAIGVEADCVEAIYNLGLANRRLALLPDSAQAFRKLHRLLPDDLGVVWQLGSAYEAMGDADQALHFFHSLQSAAPTDPQLLSHIAELYHSSGDETNAFHHYSDAHRLLPTHLPTLSWLGVWCVKNEMWDDAVGYFACADTVEAGGGGGGPDSSRWKLMMASCWRRMGDKERAWRMYERVHSRDENCVEAVKYLLAMSREDGREKEIDKWARVLERMQKGGGAGDERRVDVKGEEDMAKGGSAGAGGWKGSREEEKTRALSVSPAGSPKGGRVLDASFKHDLAPEEKRQNINQGRAGDEEDEWGDEGLGDDMLPL